MGLETVVPTAQGRDVARAGRPAPGVGDDVVPVAAVVPVRLATTGGSGAPREDAGLVAQGDLLTEPVGHLVGSDVHVFGQVNDRLDDDVGLVGTAPVGDLTGSDQVTAGVLHAPRGTGVT